MMQNNRTFWKALHSLSHPLSILATLLLLFNDHYLRYQFPSWLTGKLGDFTWLLFAPFIAAMLFSLLAPQRPRFIGLLSLGFIGLWFASFKTMPFVMNLTKDVLESLVGWRGTLGMDVTDLITLPALLISWHIWKNAPEDSRYLRPVISVAFGLGLLGTMATSPPSKAVSVGTVCELADGALRTHGEHGRLLAYLSEDGGLTWRASNEDVSESDYLSANCGDREILGAENLENGTLYRWVRGERVEYSIDDGSTWLLLRDLYELRQEVRQLINHNSYDDVFNSNATYYPSPVSGIVHSQTGNLVLAMSSDGVLVITPNGESFWAAVGDFQLADLSDWNTVSSVFSLYSSLVITLFFLILVTTINLIDGVTGLRGFGTRLGWFSWLVLLTFVFQVDGFIYNNVGLMWLMVAISSLVAIALPLTAWALHDWLRYYRSATLPIFITSALACLANFFPLFLWSQGTIPRYYVAMVFSVFLTGAVLAACYSYYRPKLPSRHEPEKAKRKNDEL